MPLASSFMLLLCETLRNSAKLCENSTKLYETLRNSAFKKLAAFKTTNYLNK
ncbi:MAG: hypothetical protein RI894_1097 [Bacteroidota bacterium]|jgi:hypothetical protein